MVDEFGTDLKVVGGNHLDYEATKIVTGKYDFAYDHFLPGKLFARTMGSPHAHANILSIDTSRAEALEGVKAVITFEDNPRWSGTILFWGQPIAAVAAVDEVTAERALDLIDVEYEILPFIIDAEEAMKPGSTLSGVFEESNLGSPRLVERGDIAAGFEEATVTIDETVDFHDRHTMNHLEPEAAMAYWDGDDCYAFDCNQNLWGHRSTLRQALGIPFSKVHMTVHGIGGGFGGKGMTNEYVPVALLSKKAGQPVVTQRQRRLQSPNRRNQYEPKLNMKIGMKADGTLTAIDAHWWAEGGGSGGRGTYDMYSETWNCANVRDETVGVATNKGVAGGYRCLGHSGGCIHEDTMLERAAVAVGLSPLEFRRKIYVTDDMPSQGNGNPFACHSLRVNLERIAQEMDFENKYHAPGTKTLPDGRMHGIGITCHNDSHGGGLGTAGIIINMNADGTAYFNNGSTRLQPGACTSIGATIAEILGMTFDKVQVGTFGNTDTAAEGPPQYGSGATTANSFAAMDAALDVKKQLFKEAAEMLEVDPEDLDASEGVIFVKTNPTVSTTHADVMGGISRPIIGRGTKVGLQPSNVIRKPVGDFPIGTSRFHRASTGAGTEVAVDTETGEVEILKHVIVVDAGRIIDGIGATIQVQSAWEHMIHKSKYWSVKYDPGTGVLLSQTHLDDKIPTSLDVPIEKMEFVILEGIGAAGPWGAHGLGEPPASNLQSVLNAVNNALGTQITQRPWTNIRILKALGKG